METNRRVIYPRDRGRETRQKLDYTSSRSASSFNEATVDFASPALVVVKAAPEGEQMILRFK